jgi:hypothetical protein
MHQSVPIDNHEEGKIFHKLEFLLWHGAIIASEKKPRSAP